MLYQQTAILLIPFLGTSLGSAMVFFTKNKINEKFQKFLLGFASGVMIAASVWSLIIPSVEMSAKQNVIEWLPAAVGFLLGIGFLLLLDSVIPHLHLNSDKPEGVKSRLSKNTMLSLAVGIAIQNFPEGAIISLPLKDGGCSKLKSFYYGVISGAVEPIGAMITLIFAGIVTQILPYLLSFAAGAMIYVVTEELIPESQSGKHSNIGTIGVAIGFVIMMILDVSLG